MINFNGLNSVIKWSWQSKGGIREWWSIQGFNGIMMQLKGWDFLKWWAMMIKLERDSCTCMFSSICRMKPLYVAIHIWLFSSGRIALIQSSKWFSFGSSGGGIAIEYSNVIMVSCKISHKIYINELVPLKFGEFEEICLMLFWSRYHWMRNQRGVLEMIQGDG